MSLKRFENNIRGARYNIRNLLYMTVVKEENLYTTLLKVKIEMI